MRAVWLTGWMLATLAAGADSGFPPRAQPSDYPAHETIKDAALAAAVIPADRVRKIFSAEIAKAYVVVEVAIYPADGHSFDVDPLDFALKVGGQLIRPEKPRDVSIPWTSGTSGPRVGGPGPAVSTDAGVIVARGTDPSTGRPRTGIGTYDSVTVSNYPPPDAAAPPPRKPDQSAMEARIRDQALPEEALSKPVAGYLYFPQYGRKRKNQPLALNYSKGVVSIDLKKL